MQETQEEEEPLSAVDFACQQKKYSQLVIFSERLRLIGRIKLVANGDNPIIIHTALESNMLKLSEEICELDILSPNCGIND
jgi:hypothetical protein